MRRLVLGAVAAASLLLFVGPAQALELEIVDQSGSPEEAYVTVFALGAFDVPGMTNDQPVKLSSIPGGKLQINKLVAGRIYVSYGEGVTSAVPHTSMTRYHWAELTLTPSPTDVANLTGVDQFGLAMRLDTLSGTNQVLETLSSANADTVFDALREIPGGQGATVWDAAHKNILRVLSPARSDAYPDLGDYVRSMSGQTITLRPAFFGNPFTTSSYSGTFAADGSITLTGTTNPIGGAPASIPISGAQLISDIYTGANTPNTLQGAIYRDLLSAFSVGYWGGKYGNDALDFCSKPTTTPQGSFCLSGFNQPAFGDARRVLAPFATCEQYAAVINELTDAYGNPYSDASKQVQLNLHEAARGGDVASLRLTVLADEGSSKPVNGGSANCGAGGLGGAVRVNDTTKVKGGRATIGTVSCPPACGRLEATAIAGRHDRVVARGRQRHSEPGAYELKVRLTTIGKRKLRRNGRIKVRHRIRLRGSGELIDTQRGRHVLTR